MAGVHGFQSPIRERPRMAQATIASAAIKTPADFRDRGRRPRKGRRTPT